MCSSPVALRRRRPLVLAVALVLLVALVVVVVALAAGGDDRELRIVRGAPSAGFPLRGDGARDEATIRSAAEAWVRDGRREDEAWADDDRLDVTALWAGRVSGDSDGVVLASGYDAAVLQRVRGRDYWEISEAVIDEAEDPVVVATASAALVREGTEARFLPAEPEGRGAGPVREDAGLWHRDTGGIPAGTLVLPDGLRSRFSVSAADRPAVGIFFDAPGSRRSGRVPALRELSPRLLRRLTTGPDATASPGAQRLVAAADAAGSVAGDDAPRQRPTELPRLDLLAVRTLPPLGPVVVLSARPALLAGRSADRRPSLVAAAGGTTVASGKDAATPIPLGGADTTQRADDGPGLGAAYVRRETLVDDPLTSADDDTPPRVDGPYLLVAGDQQVASVEVRAGRRTASITPPVGLVPAPWARSSDTRDRSTTDVAVLGRTPRGAVVVPDWPGIAVAAVRFRK